MEEEIKDYVAPILIKDLGMRFPTENSKYKTRYGLFKCFCGNEFEVRISSIKSGNTKACGCLQGEKHNGRKDKLYAVWLGIKSRCNNSNNKDYKSYGARGIIICDKWKSSYITFRDWALNNGYTQGLSIDRIDTNGNYEPSNCRWTDKYTQARNTRLLKSNNKSGFRGVFWSKKANKWEAQIKVNSKTIYLGYFKTAIEGAIAYNNYVTENNLEHPLNIIIEEE